MLRAFALSALLSAASAVPLVADVVKLVTFDKAPATTHTFRDMNDPVMGGRSHSTFAVHAAGDGIVAGVFAGTCAIVPSLKAPGFCKVSTQDSKPYPDVSSMFSGSLALRVKTSTPQYQGFKVAFGAKGAKRPTPSRHGGPTFKADFTVSGTDWTTVYVPFNNFSIDWSDYTGECTTKDPTGQQHHCCTAAHPEVCVTEPLLKSISSFEVWAEGSEGDFSLEIDWIGATNMAGPTPTPPTPTPTPSSGKFVELVDIAKSKWRLTNDPVMGGLSHSTIQVDQSLSEVNFQGEVKIVPKLQAPGFCDAETSAPLLSKFPSATGYDGIQLVLKASGPLRQFKQSWGGRGTGNFGSYKAGFNLTETEDWQTVFIPWEQYTNKWSQFTGGCTDHGAICCSEQHPEVCPTEKAKSAIEVIGVWGEGAAGKFDLTIKSIRAAKAPSVAQPPL